MLVCVLYGTSAYVSNQALYNFLHTLNFQSPLHTNFGIWNPKSIISITGNCDKKESMSFLVLKWQVSRVQKSKIYGEVSIKKISNYFDFENHYSLNSKYINLRIIISPLTIT